MQSIQSDTQNGIAGLLVPLLLKVGIRDKDDSTPLTVDEKFAQDAVDLLKNWDYNQPTDSAAAAYFNAVWATVLKLTFADELPDGFKPDGGDRWFEVVRTLLPDKKDRWWDDRTTTDVVESRDEVLRRSMISARLELTTKLGKDPKRWEWGRLHRLKLEQIPLGEPSVPAPLRKLFNRGPYLAPGGSSIVNAFSWDASSGNFDVTSAPSMRMVVDLSNLDNSRWVNQTGISGHPGDAHYDDQLSTWLKGKDYPWPFSVNAIRDAKSDEQTFNPGPD
jgi:penicillin amidase